MDLTKKMKRKYKLRGVKIAEVSLVDRPAFQASKWMFHKRDPKQIMDFSGFALTPTAPLWHDFQISGDTVDELVIICTSVIVSAGDRIGDVTLSKDQVSDIARKFAADFKGEEAVILTPDGEDFATAHIVAFGQTDGAKISIQDAEEPIPPNSLFVQLRFTGEDAAALSGDPEAEADNAPTGVELINPRSYLAKAWPVCLQAYKMKKRAQQVEINAALAAAGESLAADYLIAVGDPQGEVFQWDEATTESATDFALDHVGDRGLAVASLAEAEILIEAMAGAIDRATEIQKSDEEIVAEVWRELGLTPPPEDDPEVGDFSEEEILDEVLTEVFGEIDGS